MILPITDRYRIAADRRSWTVEQCRGKRRQTMAPRWEPISWHPTLEGAVNALGQLMVHTSDAQTLAEAIAEIDRVATTLCQALSPQFEVRPRRRGAA